MIEFLSDANWLAPQIDFLIFLQNIRMSFDGMFDKLFLSITVLGEIWAPTLICAILYWCFDSKKGIYLFSILSMNFLITHLLKMSACVYRPWILSKEIHPVEGAIAKAASYSFPSGHSATSASTLGGLAYILRKNKFVAAILISLVLLTGFSRLWLGVHTPQDVLVGLLTGFILIFFFLFFIDFLEQDKNRYLYALAGFDVFVIIGLTFICCLNTYPQDYVDGKLLVDFHDSIEHSIYIYAYAAGLFNGIALCRRFFPFEANTSSIKIRILRGIIGTVLLFTVLNPSVEFIFKGNCDCITSFVTVFSAGFFITAIYPLIFSKLENIIKL